MKKVALIFAITLLLSFKVHAETYYGIDIDKTWGDFQGKHYDVYDPEQNIELSVRVLKAIYDAVPDKDIAKIATLWNGTGKNYINEYGNKAKEYYLNQSWNTPYEMPQIENK